MLYLVATPIGNLQDVTLRALELLKEVDAILCEDTRHSQKFLQHHGIKKPLISFHSHSDERKLANILDRLKNGEQLALISDAGSPGISDPGYKIVKMAHLNQIQVSVLPGPCAAIAGVTASGLPSDKFLFLGFLPQKKGRQTLIKSLEDLPYSVVFYESPFRVLKTLKQLLEFLGDRHISVSREISKLHEEVFTGKICEAIDKFTCQKPRGEFTMVLAPKNFKYAKSL